MRQDAARYPDSSNGLPGLNRFYCSTLRRWNGSVSCRYTASVRCILWLYWSVHLHSYAAALGDASMKRATIVLAVATFIYVLSWLMPVVDGGTTLRDGGVPGWEAFRVALSPIWSYEGLAGDDSWFSDLISVLSGLTNIGFLASVAVLAFWPQRFTRAIFCGLVLATIINALWFVLSDERGDLRIGYYLWLGSFIVLAMAARSIPARTGPSTTPSAAA